MSSIATAIILSLALYNNLSFKILFLTSKWYDFPSVSVALPLIIGRIFSNKLAEYKRSALISASLLIERYELVNERGVYVSGLSPDGAAEKFLYNSRYNILSIPFSSKVGWVPLIILLLHKTSNKDSL